MKIRELQIGSDLKHPNPTLCPGQGQLPQSQGCISKNISFLNSSSNFIEFLFPNIQLEFLFSSKPSTWNFCIQTFNLNCFCSQTSRWNFFAPKPPTGIICSQIPTPSHYPLPPPKLPNQFLLLPQFCSFSPPKFCRGFGSRFSRWKRNSIIPAAGNRPSFLVWGFAS